MSLDCAFIIRGENNPGRNAEKAKIGDQRLKKTSYITYYVAGLSFVFLVLGVLFMMFILTRPRQGKTEPTIEPIPTLNQTEIQALAQALWDHPNPLPAYLKIEDQPRASMGDTQICVVIFYDEMWLQSGSGIYQLYRLAIDGIDEPGKVLGVRTREDGRLSVRACVAHPLTSGIHLVELHDGGTVFYQWAVRVE